LPVNTGASLLELAAELVDIPSVSHNERDLADHIQEVLSRSGWLRVERIGDNVIACTSLGRAGRLILAGHLDTVPANGNARARIDQGVLWGLGSADMKGGLAVMLELAGSVPEPSVDLTYVFYAREEVARRHNGLLEIQSQRPELLRGDAAILGEPTGAVIEAGCQGTLRAEVQLGGKRAHTARPWMGVNALHRLGPLLATLAAWPERRPIIDGCQYREALQVVGISGGVAGNVVPDRAELVLNHRFAPDRDAETAFAGIVSVVGPLLEPGLGDRISLEDSAPGALPGLGDPMLAALLSATGQAPRAKLGWTDVAFFAERGVPAVNFGPGDPELAHTADERLEADQLARVHRALFGLVTARR
jgi:succinyl-diaminopimelate desuccinylase